jgi:hypothetical protein
MEYRWRTYSVPIILSSKDKKSAWKLMKLILRYDCRIMSRMEEVMKRGLYMGGKECKG